MLLPFFWDVSSTKLPLLDLFCSHWDHLRVSQFFFFFFLVRSSVVWGHISGAWLIRVYSMTRVTPKSSFLNHLPQQYSKPSSGATLPLLWVATPTAPPHSTCRFFAVASFRWMVQKCLPLVAWAVSQAFLMRAFDATFIGPFGSREQ